MSVGCPLGVRWVSVGCPLRCPCGVRSMSFYLQSAKQATDVLVNYLFGISNAVFEILIREPKISQLAHTVFIEKYVSSCKVTMDYLTKDKLKILLPSDFSRVT